MSTFPYHGNPFRVLAQATLVVDGALKTASRPMWPDSPFDESEELLVDLSLSVGTCRAERPCRPQRRFLMIFEESSAESGRSDDLVVVAMEDQGRYVDSLEVFR